MAKRAVRLIDLPAGASNLCAGAHQKTCFTFKPEIYRNRYTKARTSQNPELPVTMLFKYAAKRKPPNITEGLDSNLAVLEQRLTFGNLLLDQRMCASIVGPSQLLAGRIGL